MGGSPCSKPIMILVVAARAMDTRVHDGKMKSERAIVSNWLPAYTGTPFEQFDGHILLIDFGHHLERFAQWHGVAV